MYRAVRLRCFTSILVALGALPVAAIGDDTAALDARIAAHLADSRAAFDPRAAAALDRIDGLGRRLLAARAYLRAGPALAERWSWSQSQIDQYPGSTLQRALDAEIDKVRVAFEIDNPGYTLWVNPEVRSVELQVERWNQNATVASAADSLLEEVRRAATSGRNDSAGKAEARTWFADVLRNAVPKPTPPLAAPGLSRHGRMQAVDFQVRRGEETVAGPNQDEIATVWDAQGWCERLVRAVRFASDRFEGPLVTPNEPWHYEYMK